jgi:hypothetical protein
VDLKKRSASHKLRTTRYVTILFLCSLLSTLPRFLTPPTIAGSIPLFLSFFLSKIDRHIRLLDQSIREQEMSISFGLRQGTHPSLLPDLAAPSRWSRATRVTHSPIPGLSDDEDISISAPPGGISAGSEVTIGMATGSTDGPASASPSSPAAKKGKKGKKRKMDKASSEAGAGATAGITASSSRGLKLKVPPLNAVMQGDATADPNEPKYCYCNRVSFGNVSPPFPMRSVGRL